MYTVSEYPHHAVQVCSTAEDVWGPLWSILFLNNSMTSFTWVALGWLKTGSCALVLLCLALELLTEKSTAIAVRTLHDWPGQ